MHNGGKKNPDLTPLDVIMPGINGFEVCWILKQDVETKDIPIIFHSRDRNRPIMIRVSSRRNWKEHQEHGFCRRKSA